MNGDDTDLLAKINGIVVLDDYGNIIPPGESFSVPIVTIQWSQPDLVIQGNVETTSTVGLSQTSIASASTPDQRRKKRSHDDTDIWGESFSPTPATPASPGGMRGGDKRIRLANGESVSSSQVSMNDSNKTPGEQLLLQREENGYSFVPGMRIVSKHNALPVSVWLTVTDSNYPSSIPPLIKQFIIIHGLPKQLQWFCEQVNANELLPIHHDIQLNRFMNLNQVTIKLCDEAGTILSSLPNSYQYELDVRLHWQDLDKCANVPVDFEVNQFDVEKLLFRKKHIKEASLVIPSIPISPYLHDLLNKYPFLTTCQLTASVKFKSSSVSSHSTLNIAKAVMNCTIVHIPAVTKLKLKWNETATSSPLSPNGILTVSIDEDLPKLMIVVETDDESTYVPKTTDIQFHIRYRNTYETNWLQVATSATTTSSKAYLQKASSKASANANSSSGLNVNDLFQVTRADTNDHLVLSKLQSMALSTPSSSTQSIIRHNENLQLNPGGYLISIEYHESRETLLSYFSSSSTPDASTSTSFQHYYSQMKLLLVPGKPMLFQVDPNTWKNESSLIVSNSKKSAASRCLLKNVGFVFKDKFGNQCKFPENTIICVKVMLDDSCVYDNHINESADVTLPQLTGSETLGYIRGEMNYVHSSLEYNDYNDQCIFTNISLNVDNAGTCRDGRYYLVFFTENLLTGEMNEFPSIANTFQLMTDSGRIEKANKLQVERSELLEVITKYQNSVAQVQQSIQSLDAQVQDHLSKCKKKNLGCHEDSLQHLETIDEEVLNDLIETKSRLQRQIQDMNVRMTQLRECHFVQRKVLSSSLLSRVNSEHVLGYVADLGYVEDPYLAKILSWAAMSCIDCLLVQDSTIALEFYRQGYKTWSLDQMLPFTLHNRFV